MAVPSYQWLYPATNGCTQLPMAVPSYQWLYPATNGCTQLKSRFLESELANKHDS